MHIRELDLACLKATTGLLFNCKEKLEALKSSGRNEDDYYRELDRWLSGAIGELRTIKRIINENRENRPV